jgi:threonine/homoserine/homoserine lactone efflux protein
MASNIGSRAMSEAIGQILPLGVVVALSPIPIVGVVLMLGTPRGRVNGPAFVAGWIVGLAVAGSLALFVAGGAGASEGGAPATWVGWLKIFFGAVLLRVAVKQWRGRPRAGEEAALPGWMTGVDHFTAGRSAALAVALAAINPKNLVLVLSAAAAIAQTGIGAGEQAAALAVFVAIGTLGPAIPVLLYLTMGERSKHALDELKGWMAHNSATIMAVICLVIAAKLIGDGIAAL